MGGSQGHNFYQWHFPLTPGKEMSHLALASLFCGQKNWGSILPWFWLLSFCMEHLFLQNVSWLISVNDICLKCWIYSSATFPDTYVPWGSNSKITATESLPHWWGGLAFRWCCEVFHDLACRRLDFLRMAQGLSTLKKKNPLFYLYWLCTSDIPVGKDSKLYIFCCLINFFFFHDNIQDLCDSKSQLGKI